ncbi:hypothetical protein OG21DRAFT_1524746 [Imleria badia]|nr:hypothetical protein OG21DRAFT_1524746 [Imleria badia]
MNAPLDQLDDWDLDSPSPGASDSVIDIPEEIVPPASGFVESYEGCKAFPSGRTFMDTFCDDQTSLSLFALESSSALEQKYFPQVYLGCSLLSHPVLAPHISFVPWKVWISTAKICCIYDEWLSRDRAWDIQCALPTSATILGVVFALDKTNISVITGNHMVYLVLISLANIDANIHSKTSLHGYLLLVLLPLPKFIHKESCTAATVGVMMSNLVVGRLGLNGVVDLVWIDWPLSKPCKFITPEPLHHFYQFFWVHDVKWCIAATGATELNFCISLLQTPIRYCAYKDGISKLKQALVFTDDSLTNITKALQDFHDHKDAIKRILREFPSWNYFKASSQVSVFQVQWSTDPLKMLMSERSMFPPRPETITTTTTRSRATLTMWRNAFASTLLYIDDDGAFEKNDEHEPDPEDAPYFAATSQPTINYFMITDALARGCIPNAIKPYCTLLTATTAFHLASKSSLRLSVDEVSAMFNLPDLRVALAECLYRLQNATLCLVLGARSGQNHTLPFDHLQISYKIHVQQMQYHDKYTPNAPQTLHVLPPSTTNPHGLYDAVIINMDPDSDWPRWGLEGHSVTQLCLIFCPLHTELLAIYVQRFNIVP